MEGRDEDGRVAAGAREEGMEESVDQRTGLVLQSGGEWHFDSTFMTQLVPPIIFRLLLLTLSDIHVVQEADDEIQLLSGHL